MGETLYLKYRPKDLNSLIGQETVVKILKNSVDYNKVGHSYIFYGPRGTGKTSAARIFAKLVNCSDLKNGNFCGECNNCLKFDNSLDVIEIDGATNNGVDVIRNLKEGTNFSPNELKYKIYIIDEFHMISTSGFNALLKTLEEPPKHVIFILATTEIQKVPETILSRCTILEFEKINDKVIFERLKDICNLEGVEVEEEALNEIAYLSNGGMRDAISLLQKTIIYVGDKKISISDVEKVSGNIGSRYRKEFVDYYTNYNNKIFELLIYLENAGVDIVSFLDMCINDIGNKMNENNCSTVLEFNEFVDLMKKSTFPYITIKACIYKKNMNAKNKNENYIEISNDVKIVEKLNNDRKDFSVNFEKRKSDTMKNANKEEKRLIVEKWADLEKGKLDINIGYYCGELLNFEVAAASDEYLMIYSQFESVVENVNKKISEFEKVLNDLLKINHKLVAITTNEWKIIVDNYIKNIKKNNVVKDKNNNSFDELFKNVERMD